MHTCETPRNDALMKRRMVTFMEGGDVAVSVKDSDVYGFKSVPVEIKDRTPIIINLEKNRI